MKGQEKFTTQCYIKGEPKNSNDGVLNAIMNPKEKASVILPFTRVKESRIGELAARFDIVMGFTPTL
jgi:protocatechuate 3,4-dioxygenase beta subunit